MTDKKTPEQRAAEELKPVADAWHQGFECGKRSFIRDELPGILEKARDGIGTESLYNDYTYTINELLAMAEKGEG